MQNRFERSSGSLLKRNMMRTRGFMRLSWYFSFKAISFRGSVDATRHGAARRDSTQCFSIPCVDRHRCIFKTPTLALRRGRARMPRRYTDTPNTQKSNTCLTRVANSVALRSSIILGHSFLIGRSPERYYFSINTWSIWLNFRKRANLFAANLE